MSSPTPKCPYLDCPKVKYKECEIHGNQCSECGQEFVATNSKNNSSKLAAKWEEEFDKKFSTNRNSNIGAPENENHPHIITKSASRDIKSFIRSLLLSQQDRIMKAIKDLPNTYEDDEAAVFQTTKNEILQIIKENNESY